MQTAKLPDNEQERLASLRELRILDTKVEASFDELTALAAEICQTPIALVSLLDEHRQWFKSRYGLEAEQTDRNVAFCAHAILKDQLFEIPDSSKDVRFHDNPLVTGKPKVMFYAGVPLLTPDRLALGTLCVIDHAPRELSAFQRKTLRTLAQQVSNLLELRRATNRLAEVKAAETALAVVATYNHEINNPLAVAMGLLSLNEKAIPPQIHGKMYSALKRIHQVIVKVDMSLREHGVEFKTYSGGVKMLKVD